VWWWRWGEFVWYPPLSVSTVLQWRHTTEKTLQPLSFRYFSSTSTTKNFLPRRRFPIITTAFQSKVPHYHNTLQPGIHGNRYDFGAKQYHPTSVFLWCWWLNKTKLSHEWCSHTDGEQDFKAVCQPRIRIGESAAKKRAAPTKLVIPGGIRDFFVLIITFKQPLFPSLGQGLNNISLPVTWCTRWFITLHYCDLHTHTGGTAMGSIDSFWSHDIYSSFHPGEGSSSVALLKVSYLFSLWKGFFYFFLIRGEVKGQGCRMSTVFKALWGKLVICENGLYKINWIEFRVKCLAQGHID